jgi:hypothetical protein
MANARRATSQPTRSSRFPSSVRQRRLPIFIGDATFLAAHASRSHRLI